MNRFFIAEQPVNTVCEFKENVSLKDLLEELRPFPVAPTRLTVSRSSILSDSVSIFKQRSFDFRKPLKITFEGDPAIDGGGPKREYFTLVLRQLLSPSASPRLFEGRGNVFLPMHNSDALRSNLYKVAGRIVATSIIHGGPGFPVFPRGLYIYFQNQKTNDVVDHISEEDVVDADCVDALSKVTFINTVTLTPICTDAFKISAYPWSNAPRPPGSSDDDQLQKLFRNLNSRAHEFKQQFS